ncbi:MAG: hypothetical protein IPL59_18570 [Candidatus Competibacteraceae bacterium]|nr:hypothetical protein [Candidatus Competibacteraceae bacterium]
MHQRYSRPVVPPAALCNSPSVTIKDAELEVLTADQDPIGRNHPDSVFYARALPRPVWINR